MPRTSIRSRPYEALSYRVELWEAHGRRVLARALNAPLARAIFRAAIGEHPEARIVLARGTNVIEDSRAGENADQT